MSCLDWFLSRYQTLLLFLFLVTPILGEGSKIIRGAMHTIVSVECNRYFSFQTLGLFYSFKRVGMSGPFTRIMACSPEQRQKYSQEDMELMNTHITPQFSHGDILDDEYSPYNRPMGIMHWMEHAKPREEWVLLVDPDMIFRHPVLPSQLRVPQGWARAAHYMQLVGTRHELADKYIPNVEKRSDSYGGAVGRRGDEVGVFFFMRMEDMKRVAPLYMNFTRNVRADPDAFTLSHSSNGVVGKPMWISEMYGWSFAMAKTNIWHLVDPTILTFPHYYIHDIPRIIHYVMTHKVEKYVLDKGKHREFDITKCPPWNLHTNRRQEEDGGLLPHPPLPSKVGVDPYHGTTPAATGRRYGKLLIIESVNTVNEALCERHYKKCPMSQELLTECGKVQRIRDELDTEFAILDKIVCVDVDKKECHEAKKNGECDNSWLDMSYKCRGSCGLCTYNSVYTKKKKSIENQLASLPHHMVKELPVELASIFQKIPRQSKSKSKNLDTRCRKFAAGEVTGDLECARWWSLHHGLNRFDIVHGRVGEDGFPTFSYLPLSFTAPIVAGVLCFLLARLRSRRLSSKLLL